LTDYSLHNDRMPRPMFLDWLSKVFGEMYRVLKPGGSLFLVINGSGTADDFLLSKGAEFSFKVGAEYSAVWRTVCGW